MEELGRSETGSRSALPIWIDFMEEAVATRPGGEFAVPDGVSFAATAPYAAGRKTRRSTYVAPPPPPPVTLPADGAPPVLGALAPAVGAPPGPLVE
jgi:hypothetical protein